MYICLPSGVLMWSVMAAVHAEPFAHVRYHFFLFVELMVPIMVTNVWRSVREYNKKI